MTRAWRHIETIRREKLRQLRRRFKTNAELSKAIGWTAKAYVSQLIGKNPTRAIGNETARKIERALGLPPNWLDVERDVDDELAGLRAIRANVQAVVDDIDARIEAIKNASVAE